MLLCARCASLSLYYRCVSVCFRLLMSLCLCVCHICCNINEKLMLNDLRLTLNHKCDVAMQPVQFATQLWPNGAVSLLDTTYRYQSMYHFQSTYHYLSTYHFKRTYHFQSMYAYHYQSMYVSIPSAYHFQSVYEFQNAHHFQSTYHYQSMYQFLSRPTYHYHRMYVSIPKCLSLPK